MLFSILGSRMQTAAVLWHVYELSDKPIALGGVGLVTILPILLLSLPAGAVADIRDRRKLMFITQSTLALLAALLGAITARSQATVPIIYIIIALSSAIWAFDTPARQSLIPNLVPPSALTNAFSMNGIAIESGAILGPGLGGIIIARFGIEYAYYCNAISFGTVLLALALMGPIPQRKISKSLRQLLTKDLRVEVGEGLRFVLDHPIIFPSMLLDFFATFFSTASALLPIFARDILGLGVVGYGWLAAAPSVGAALVALGMAFVTTIRRQGPLLLVAVLGFGFATVLFGISRVFWLTFLALSLTGSTDMFSMILRNTMRQIQTPDSLRGRMTSVNQMFFMGGPQLGELEAGLIAQWLGPVVAVVSGGIGCLVAVGWVASRFPGLARYDGEPTYQPETGASPAA
jgi:MFS family permease